MGRGKGKKKQQHQMLGPKQCALCGRQLYPTDYNCIVGATGRLVCAGCLHVSRWMLEGREETPKQMEAPTDGVLTPQEIMAELDKSIIGQENAKRAVAIAL